MADPATSPSELQNEVVIADVLELLVAVKPQPIMHLPPDKECLMNHVATAAIAQDSVIVFGFLAPVDFVPFAVHIKHVAKQTVPLRMGRECFAHLLQNTRTKAIVRIQDHYHVPGCALNALVHCVIMALVLF